ncbi:unnamed protein product [Protopolystoma xenopodis]|uniref:Uncharacterized protein n=1 Tax=Protopolystoma xenopodis TaxID=117903 RepID=A0A3S5C5G5_9PLAT|nr:unnamed protein product [Protopolystoma xenopodis]
MCLSGPLKPSQAATYRLTLQTARLPTMHPPNPSLPAGLSGMIDSAVFPLDLTTPRRRDGQVLQEKASAVFTN